MVIRSISTKQHEAKYQTEIITHGVLKQLLDVLSGDPTKDVASTLVTKTLSVIYHFDGTKRVG
jgi:hypothetical protein